jgi:iron complex outermembrane receptor protein
MGILAQGFYEKRHLRRDGVESLGYEQIAAGSPIALTNPDLANVWYPKALGAALFEQERKRTGGLFDIELKPNSSTTLDLNGFYSKLEASNYNRNYLVWGTHFVNAGQGQAPDPGYVVRNGTLVSASFANDGVTQHGIYDQISRPGEGSETKYLDFDGEFRVNDRLKLNTKVGGSKGIGSTPSQDVMEFDLKGTGAQWQLNGDQQAPNFSLPGGNDSAPNANTALDWIFGSQNVKVADQELWQQVDGDYALDWGPVSTLKFGVRATEHKRDSLHVVAQGPLNNAAGQSPFDQANWPTTFSNYPSDFGSGLGGSIPSNIWFYTPAQLAAFNAQFTNRDPIAREYFPQEFKLHENTGAGYLQANLEGEKWSGDVGLRLVNTKENVTTFQPATATTPGALTGSLFGAYVPVNTIHSYNDILPSANLRLELSKTLIGRLAASRTMTRPDYSQIAGTVSLSPPAVAGGIGSGSGGNPDLKPITSNNLDASLEWYFADRALLSVSAFYMDLTSYVGLGKVNKTYITYDQNNPNGAPVPYELTVPINSSGKVKGLELGYEQPLFNNFGVSGNYTYTDAEETGGGPLVGASKNTYNVGGYFENDLFNARVSWNHRSAFYSGLDRSTAFYQDAVGTLTATLGVKINKYVTVRLDARNLNNPKLKYYALNKDQPRSIYENGRQYYLTASFEY